MLVLGLEGSPIGVLRDRRLGVGSKRKKKSPLWGGGSPIIAYNDNQKIYYQTPLAPIVVEILVVKRRD